MGSCAAPSAKGDDKFITTDYLQQCLIATIIGAWVGGGLVDRFGRAPVALISGVVGGVAMAS
ncbi:hypothetical protein, partial [Citrobacter gillenii]|uniref:hypothetical protein n=1 Tax=Citrobacter gillenii TaxID=67828 RepID=UPI0039880DE8